MGFFSGLAEESYDRSYRDRELVMRMLVHFRHKGKQLAGILLAIILQSFASALTPIWLSNGVDYLNDNNPAAVPVIAAGLFLFGVIIWGMNWIRRRMMARVAGDVMLALRENAFQSTIHHDLSFFDEFSSGRIVSRITSDTQEFAKVVVLLTDIFSQMVQSIILFAVLIQIDVKLTLVVIMMLPAVGALGYGFRAMARRVTRRGMRVMANVNALIKEAVTGIGVAKNFRQEAAIYEEFEDVNQQSYQVNIRRGLTLAMVFPILNAIGGIGTSILVYTGGMRAATGAITIGAWYLFTISLDRFWFPILNLSSFWSQIQQGLSAAERVFALIDAEPVVIQTETKPVTTLRGEITFSNLNFQYLPHEAVLRDFNLHIEPGENIALVGHTGAGKSSIARLVARFYEFQEGKLHIDGQDIRTFELASYRRRLGIISQTPFLFDASVAENIRYASPDASENDIQALANQIGSGEWVATLPDGLQTYAGERGSRLSMGQRQLVALMRVLIQKPSIFILDEATASIDPFTESQIQEALGLILAKTTSILIAHRLSTVRAADRILVLDHGRIIEEGCHDVLLKQHGTYADLYNTYFRHQSLSYIENARDNT
ncbi:MAG: ABC transporter ATP-binding protein [Anaerolineales bacterium]|nr:ABC transporter ATP-binding protein [Anaerolineales bacterium]